MRKERGAFFFRNYDSPLIFWPVTGVAFGSDGTLSCAIDVVAR
jgi:hypothetical protein